jgi:hypothetical protein
VNVSITGTYTDLDNPRQIRENNVGKLLIKKRAIVETMRIGLTSANMPIPEMHGDG